MQVSRTKRLPPSDSEQQRTVLQLILATLWMAGCLRNLNCRGSDRDAYESAHDSPPAALSGTLDQRPVSTHTPVSPQLHHISRSPILRQLSRLPSHQMMSLSLWLPVCQIQRQSRRHHKPRPQRWIRISQPSLGPLHAQLLTLMSPYSREPNHPNTAKGPSTKHPRCWQLILCSVDFLLLFHYLSDCASFVV